jgi:hypothetical protein
MLVQRLITEPTKIQSLNFNKHAMNFFNLGIHKAGSRIAVAKKHFVVLCVASNPWLGTIVSEIMGMRYGNLFTPLHLSCFALT